MKIIIAALVMISSFTYAKTNIVVSILPQKTFVEKIGGSKVIVNAMVKPGSDPHTYEPKASQMKNISKADIYFPIGIEFEKVWLEKFKNQNKNMKIIEMTKGIKYIDMPKHNHHEHASIDKAYEWVGLFHLKEDKYTWSFSKVNSEYADDKIKMLILKMNDNSKEAVEELEKKAQKIFSSSKAISKKDLSTLNKTNTLYEINFNNKKEINKININIKENAAYLIFTEHLPYEFEKDEHFFKNSKNVDIEVLVEDPYREKEHEGHNHDKEAHSEHSHEGHDHSSSKDPHVWLSPSNVKIIAKNIYTSLVNIDASNKEYYKKNYINFLKEISDTDNEIRSIFVDIKDSAKFMVFHPSWGYFAKDYSLIQLVIEVEGKEPKPKTLKRIIDQAKKENITAIFAQKEFSDKSAQVIAKELNIQVIQETPLDPNWSENLINMAKAIANTK